jgi:signal transduction histidine kinase
MPGGGRLTIAVRLLADSSVPSAAPDGDSPAGAVAADVAPASPGGPARLLVEITDTGIGMDQEAVGRIFEPYFSTKATGTGLGLTIAKRNIELNGGTIEVRSQRGVGTTVRLMLPLT